MANEEVNVCDPNAAKYLGKQVDYPTEYDPDILVPISRKKSLESCNIDPDAYQWYGFDMWRMWEVRFKLDSNKSVQRIGKALYDAHSSYMIESKSMKLYFFSQMFDKLGKTSIDAESNFKNRVTHDLKSKIDSWVTFDSTDPIQYSKNINSICEKEMLFSLDHLFLREIDLCVSPVILDEIDSNEFTQGKSDVIDYDDKDLIKVTELRDSVKRVYVYYGERSNCLVTNQPDFATTIVITKGACELDKASLLNYLQSFETVSRFHESTCHTIFDRIVKKLREKDKESEVTVISFYTRRGGIDITPFRTTDKIHYEKIFKLFSDKGGWLKTWNQ